MRWQRPCGAEHDAARLLLDHAGVLSTRALRTGIEGRLAERHLLRQRDARLGAVDDEGPAVAGGVPVQLVVVREEPDLPRGAIADDVFVLAAPQQAVSMADAQPHAVRDARLRPIFRLAGAGDRFDLEADDNPGSVRAGVDGREVAQDPAADHIALGLHPDGLGHAQVATALDDDVADETE